MLERMWSNQNFHTLLLEVQNTVIMLENSLPVSYKIKHILSYDSGLDI